MAHHNAFSLATREGFVAPKVDYLFKLEQMGINTRVLLFGDQHLYELNSREQTLLELYRQMNEHMQLQTLGLLLARITEESTPNGDNNSNSALIAGIQSIKTSQKNRKYQCYLRRGG